VRRAILSVLALVACAGCRGSSDPAEMARERGAIELLRAWPCADGKSHFGDVAGGDLKTDWAAARQPDGSYRVTIAQGGRRDSWAVRVDERQVRPETDGARGAWSACATGAPAR
jgi:hypothetical protein